MTLDPAKTPGVSPNDVAWDEFANLLYIDAPSSGFSYAINPVPDAFQPDHRMDMDREAAVVGSALLRFLDRHPPLQANPVIVVGESYGGARASLMLRHIFDYTTLVDTNSAYFDVQLSADLLDYFGDVFHTTTPDTGMIAGKFGHQVLLEPMLVGYYQSALESMQAYWPDPWQCALPTDDCRKGETCDGYDCAYANPTWSIEQRDEVAKRLSTPELLKVALGTEPRSIRWMYAQERVGAYGRGTDGAEALSTADMIGVFGDFSDPNSALYNPWDNYFVSLNFGIHEGYGAGTETPAMLWLEPKGSVHVATAFARNVRDGVRTFITFGRRDAVVRSDAIPDALEYLCQNPALAPDFASFVTSVPAYDNAYPAFPSVRGAVGAMKLNYASGEQIYIAMPQYDAGHMVEMGAPAELREDVIAWYLDSLQ